MKCTLCSFSVQEVGEGSEGKHFISIIGSVGKSSFRKKWGLYNIQKEHCSKDVLAE